MNRAGYAVLFAVTVSIRVAGAQTNDVPATLSIEEAVIKGLKNNRGLQVQQYEPVIAGTFEQIERGAYDPQLFASLGRTEENSTETDRATETQFQVEGSDTFGEAGVRQRLATGTELEVSVMQDRTISTRAPEQQSARLGLSLTQQLLRGMGPSVNLAAIRQAELDTKASQQELRGYTEAMVADIEITYWRYVSAREAINVVQSSLEVAEAQLKDVESRIEVGDLPRNEAAAAQAEVALRKQNLIDAQSLLARQRYTLLRLVDPDLLTGKSYPLEAISRPEANLSLEPDVYESLSLALQSRPELREAELLLRRGELETVVTRNGRLPRLQLFINLGKSGYADTFRDSFRELDGESYDVTVGIEFTQALGNRTARAQDMIALKNVRQGEEALANLRDLVRFDVFIAINELERARKQISASSETRGYREQTLQAERDRFEVGAATALDVALAQRDLVESQINEIEARVAFLVARIRLYLAEGTLLERRGLLTGS